MMADGNMFLAPPMIDPIINTHLLATHRSLQHWGLSGTRTTQRESPTKQADVFSAGVLLYHILTGSLPFPDVENPHGSDPSYSQRSGIDSIKKPGDSDSRS